MSKTTSKVSPKIRERAVRQVLDSQGQQGSRWQAETAVARHIDGFYNPVRRHASLGIESHVAFEQKARNVS